MLAIWLIVKFRVPEAASRVSTPTALKLIALPDMAFRSASAILRLTVSAAENFNKSLFPKTPVKLSTSESVTVKLLPADLMKSIPWALRDAVLAATVDKLLLLLAN